MARTRRSSRPGGWVVVSGQVGAVDGSLVPGGFDGQCNQALANLRDRLESVGAAMTDVVKTTVFLRHLADYARMNELYWRPSATTGPPAARSPWPSSPWAPSSRSKPGPTPREDDPVLGAVIIVVVLLVVLPVLFLMGGAVVAAIFGESLRRDAEHRHEGSELLDLN